MSTGKWAYTAECDRDNCTGHCELCDKNPELKLFMDNAISYLGSCSRFLTNERLKEKEVQDKKR